MSGPKPNGPAPARFVRMEREVGQVVGAPDVLLTQPRRGADKGWVVAGTLGALAWGAPLVAGAEYPPDFYVPSATDLRRAELRLDIAPRFEQRACTVTVAPTPIVCRERYGRPNPDSDTWPFAHVLFAALDLAQDQGRGAEALQEWNPVEFTRVW